MWVFSRTSSTNTLPSPPKTNKYVGCSLPKKQRIYVSVCFSTVVLTPIFVPRQGWNTKLMQQWLCTYYTQQMFLQWDLNAKCSQQYCSVNDVLEISTGKWLFQLVAACKILIKVYVLANSWHFSQLLFLEKAKKSWKQLVTNNDVLHCTCMFTLTARSAVFELSLARTIWSWPISCVSCNK